MPSLKTREKKVYEKYILLNLSKIIYLLTTIFGLCALVNFIFIGLKSVSIHTLWYNTTRWNKSHSCKRTGVAKVMKIIVPWYDNYCLFSKVSKRKDPCEQWRDNQMTNLNWKQCIFAHRMPRKLKHVSRIWLLLRGTYYEHFDIREMLLPSMM